MVKRTQAFPGSAIEQHKPCPRHAALHEVESVAVRAAEFGKLIIVLSVTAGCSMDFTWKISSADPVSVQSRFMARSTVTISLTAVFVEQAASIAGINAIRNVLLAFIMVYDFRLSIIGHSPHVYLMQLLRKGCRCNGKIFPLHLFFTW